MSPPGRPSSSTFEVKSLSGIGGRRAKDARKTLDGRILDPHPRRTVSARPYHRHRATSSHDETCPLNLTEVRRFYDRWMTLGKRPGLIAASCRCRRTGTARSESAYPWPAHRADCHDGGP